MLWLILTITCLAVPAMVIADGKLLLGKKTEHKNIDVGGRIVHRCLTPKIPDRQLFPLSRKNPWSLPDRALAANFNRTVNILVLRFNFQLEQQDDPRTTGSGQMDLRDDTLAFFLENDHVIDPPPRDSLYFDAHMRACSLYYNAVSQGKLTLTWDIYPPGKDSILELPGPMSNYGACIDDIDPDLQEPEFSTIYFDSVIAGLERYFIDCIRLADTGLVTPIDFSKYESIFLFHAGSDQQNNIDNPPTCSDLFTGFIRFGNSIQADDGTVFVDGIPVNGGTDTVRSALLMPETASQDNRATALNAVIAHEFGHQLGLPDLYRTGSFRTQLGDFALMDNNGFGSGIEISDYPVGAIRGMIPVYPTAWSRAYLGFIDVVDFRKGTDIYLAAAQMVTDSIKAVRVPISEDEYYLIENRIPDVDGKPDSALLADPVTSVVMGPADDNRQLTFDYDRLMPGSGVIIYHVDESVARADFNQNGVNNFHDNQLQLDPDRRFIRIVEADGIVNFGGFYNAGFGSDADMYREDRNNKLTPNSNPPAIDNTGNNTHVEITNIHRDTAFVDFKKVPIDAIVRFDVNIDGLVPNFPVRCGYRIPPGIQAGLIDTASGDTALAIFKRLSTIADDLDRDGIDEIITASDQNVLVFSTAGENFLHNKTGCSPCSTHFDLAHSRYDGTEPEFVSGEIYARDSLYPMPLYFKTPQRISAGPVTGDFGEPDSSKLVAVGFISSTTEGAVALHRLEYNDSTGQAQQLFAIITEGWPLLLSFGDALYIVTYEGKVYYKPDYNQQPPDSAVLPVNSVYGSCRLGKGLIVLGGDSAISSFYYVYPATVNGNDTLMTFEYMLDAHYNIGPIIVDLNRDGQPEIVAVSDNGNIIAVTSDTSASTAVPSFSIHASKATGDLFRTPPVAADLDGDGYPEIVIGGWGKLYAYDRNLITVTDFPLSFDDRFPNDLVVAPALVADLDDDNLPELIFPTQSGNLYAIDDGHSYGFPLSGGERVNGSPLILSDDTGIKLGYRGDDGWFYLWDWWASTPGSLDVQWSMLGGDAAATFVFDQSRLPQIDSSFSLLPESQYFGYPNPVTEGSTTLRYFLGRSATSVSFSIYDLAGTEIASFPGGLDMGVNEMSWQCGDVTPGVYRCMIDVDFGGQTETAFTDIAIIR